MTYNLSEDAEALLADFPAVDRHWLCQTIDGASAAGNEPLHDIRGSEAAARDNLRAIAEQVGSLRKSLEGISINADKRASDFSANIAINEAGGGFYAKVQAMRDIEDHILTASNLLERVGSPPKRRAILIEEISGHLKKVGLPVDAKSNGPLWRTFALICREMDDEIDDDLIGPIIRRQLKKAAKRTQ